MRLLNALSRARSGSNAAPELDSLEHAESVLARLRNIAELQAKARSEIEAAEASLDQSLGECPTLDDAAQEATLASLRRRA